MSALTHDAKGVDISLWPELAIEQQLWWAVRDGATVAGAMVGLVRG